jgi:peptidoglycan hydrolase-like protein with peptidoglycan-binding domain
MEIQRALSEKGFYSGPIDGNWNAECVAALKQFQADSRLNPDGKLGALSLIALGLGPKRDESANLLGKPATTEQQ